MEASEAAPPGADRYRSSRRRSRAPQSPRRGSLRWRRAPAPGSSALPLRRCWLRVAVISGGRQLSRAYSFVTRRWLGDLSKLGLGAGVDRVFHPIASAGSSATGSILGSSMIAGSITGATVGSATATMATRVAVGRAAGALTASFVGAGATVRSGARVAVGSGSVVGILVGASVGNGAMATAAIVLSGSAARSPSLPGAFSAMMRVPANTTTRASPEATAMPGEDSAWRLRRNHPQPGVSARMAAMTARETAGLGACRGSTCRLRARSSA